MPEKYPLLSLLTLFSLTIAITVLVLVLFQREEQRLSYHIQNSKIWISLFIAPDNLLFHDLCIRLKSQRKYYVSKVFGMVARNTQIYFLIFLH